MKREQTITTIDGDKYKLIFKMDNFGCSGCAFENDGDMCLAVNQQCFQGFYRTWVLCEEDSWSGQ